MNSDQHPTELIAQVVIENDVTRTLSVLMRPEVIAPSVGSLKTDAESNWRSFGDSKCLTPVLPRNDPELREIIVSDLGGNYHVVACLASNRLASFDHAGLDIELWKGDCADGEDHCIDAAKMHGKGAADNVGQLYGRTRKMPRTVVFFVVEAKPVSALLPVKRADVTLSYTGCSGGPANKCETKSQTKRLNMRFVDVSQ
jgi:hypothetical protein